MFVQHIWHCNVREDIHVVVHFILEPPGVTVEEGTREVDTNLKALHVYQHRGGAVANISHRVVSVWHVEEGLESSLLLAHLLICLLISPRDSIASLSNRYVHTEMRKPGAHCKM